MSPQLLPRTLNHLSNTLEHSLEKELYEKFYTSNLHFKEGKYKNIFILTLVSLFKTSMFMECIINEIRTNSGQFFKNNRYIIDNNIFDNFTDFEKYIDEISMDNAYIALDYISQGGEPKYKGKIWDSDVYDIINILRENEVTGKMIENKGRIRMMFPGCLHRTKLLVNFIQLVIIDEPELAIRISDEYGKGILKNISLFSQELDSYQIEFANNFIKKFLRFDLERILPYEAEFQPENDDEKFVYETMLKALDSIESLIERKPSDIELALISSTTFFALLVVAQKPEEYGYPNKIGRASSILALRLLMDHSEEYNLTPLRNRLGLSQQQLELFYDKAIEKANDEVWSNSSARCLIIGTRSALYSLLGVDREMLEFASPIANHMSNMYRHFLKDKRLRKEMGDLVDALMKYSDDTGILETIYRLS